MTDTLIGYARCSTDKQDLTTQKNSLQKLGVAADRLYTDHGFTGANRVRPGLNHALAAVRCGGTLAVPKLDRLARFRGKPRGKKPKPGERLQRELRRVYDTGDYSVSDAAEAF